jgi:hypothetical protein
MRTFDGGTWERGTIRLSLEIPRENPELTAKVYRRVAADGPIRRSEFSNELERQIALRLWDNFYFETDTQYKNADRIYTLAPKPPAADPFELLDS